MKVWTFQEAKLKVREDLDLEEETFVGPNEYVTAFNEAIDEAESWIHKLYQGYFKKKTTIEITAGVDRYSMPTDIYANKILMVVHEKDGIRNKIDKISSSELLSKNSNGGTVYDIENIDADTGVEMVFYPPPSFTSTEKEFIEMYYIRNASKVENELDKIDIPEFINFIFAFVKERLAEKELHPLLNKFTASREKQEINMRETLDQMVPDSMDTIDPDMSFYDEFN